MKKTYISPEAIVVNLDTECIMTGSDPTLKNEMPSNDNSNNQFSGSYRTSIWGD